MSISVDSNNLSFVNDLNPGKDMWNMKARIIRKWNQGYKMDLIFIDEKGAKIQAGIKSHLIPVFDGQLQEDAVVILSKFGVGENKDLYKLVVQPYKINFYRRTTVTRVRYWQGVEYGFNFRAYEDILQGEALNALSVDVVGSVISCGDLEIFCRPPKETKKMNFDIEDLEMLGKVLRCTVWNAYALQIKDFISKIPPHEHVMAVIQHGKCKEWKGEYTVQSDKFATRIFLNEEIDEVDKLRRRHILKFGQGSGPTSQTILSSQSVFPLHKEFVTEGVKKHVDEISEIEKEMSCVVVATIKIVQEEYGWFYAACRKCFKKVMGKSEYLENVENVSDDIVRLPATSLDESGSVSFVMFDRDVQKLLGLAASDIRERQVKANDIGFPHEIFRLVDKKAAFKIDVLEFNLKNDYRVYTVQKTCDDPVIISELVVEMVTQEVADVKDVNLSEYSQVSAERTLRDVVSVTADSSAVEVEKDSGSSPNGKRMAQDADVVNVDMNLSNQTPSFLQFLNEDDFIFLNIPLDFQTLLWGKEVPYGQIVELLDGDKSWLVRVRKRDDHCIFTDGWTKFVRDCCLKTKDVVLVKVI
ncbi:uncharacterized protein LOC118481715 [Helianthus annuus]|uniref:uncharacterized protein LOC118481715 n=1 Tax=Helianthus annuus TaxID=4232 RepID=UPI001652F285|nr:uncharacterized protein LOC118481715 [Helianthus annuus]